MLFSFIIAVLLTTASGQSPCIGGTVENGPCVNGGNCPIPGNICADGTTCCGAPEIFTTTATNLANCVDKTKPNGVSDCPQLANLCNDATYYAVMTEQCPLTCGRCGGVSGTTGVGGIIGGSTTSGFFGGTGCADKTKPNGVSDCPQLANLCNDATYYTLMTEQCPATCGRCGGGVGGSTTSGFFGGTACVDLTGPNGVSDCPRLANLCNDLNYYTLMTQQCPRTCNRCTGIDLSSSTTTAFGTITTTPGFDYTTVLLANQAQIGQLLISKDFTTLANNFYHPQGLIVYAGQTVAYGPEQLLAFYQGGFADRELSAVQCTPTLLTGVDKYAIEEATCQLINTDGSSTTSSVQWIYKQLNGQFLLYHDQTDPIS